MWEQIRSNRIRSGFVVVAMGMLLVATGVALGGLLTGDVLGGGGILGGGVALLLWLILWLTAISQGDKVMLRMAGAREIRKQDHPQLFNVVEEMTIASMLPRMPRVHIVDDPSPNAFATGRKPENASVAVTTGLLSALNRDELQGVVAHEIGHVKNRDVALLTTAGIMAGAIVMLAEVGLRALWFGGGRVRRSRSDNNSGGQALVMIVAIVLMILAPIMAQLIYLALSRRREYLADASGALFTRYPEGLASALEKISGQGIPLADRSRVTAPMYIVAPLRAGAMKASSLTATHPPIKERVRILRGMGGNAGLAAYEAAYGKIHGGSVVGSRTLATAQDVSAQEPSAEDSEESTWGRRRGASDAFLAASGYQRRPCGECGAVLKIPAEMMARVARCPRCRSELAGG